MMVSNQFNEQPRPDLQVVTDEYMEQLERLEQASGCLPKFVSLARIAIGASRIPLRLAEEFQRGFSEPL